MARTKWTDEKIERVRRLKRTFTTREIAEIMHVPRSQIRDVIRCYLTPGRRRRLDLINDLPPAGQKAIAEQLGYTYPYVSGVLNGRQSQSTKKGRSVIDLAEKMVFENRVGNKFLKSTYPETL